MFSTGIAVTFVVLAALRLYTIFPRHGKRHIFLDRPHDARCKLSIFLGSGGHTSEALAMLSGLDFERYQPREYFVSEGDSLSAQKAIALEQSIATAQGLEPSTAPRPYRIVVIPRARRVHQSLLTTPASAFLSLLSCIYYVSVDPFLGPSAPIANGLPSVLVLNGPGTCLMLCLAVYLNRFLGLPSPAVIYVESFARVRSLSLSGKLIRPFTDRFIVQWPQLTRYGTRTEYRGWLV